MLLRLFVQDFVAVEEEIQVFSRRHLHAVTIQDDAQLLISAFRTVRLNFLRRFFRDDRNCAGISADFRRICDLTGCCRLCSTDSANSKLPTDLILDKVDKFSELLIGIECVAVS